MEEAKPRTQTVPVFIHNNDNFIMVAKADFLSYPDKTLLQVIFAGPENKVLAEFLEKGGPIAVSLTAIPFENRE